MSAARTPRSPKARTTTTRTPADTELVALLRPWVGIVVGADQALALAQTYERELVDLRIQLIQAHKVLGAAADVGGDARSLLSTPTPQKVQTA
jgi:hypothetical protein